MANSQERTGVADVQAFYGRWARLYDVIARYTPAISSLRARTAASLELEPGDVVVDMGCGTGANLPFLREQVGPTGTIVGIDVTRPMLVRARQLVDDEGWENVHVVRGDATRPPISGPVDAIVGSFVTGMFGDPATVIDGWCDLVASGGHIALLDAARSERRAAWPVNRLMDAFTVLSAPPTFKFRYEDDVGGQLTERVETARGTLEARATTVTRETHLLGLVRLATAELPA